MTTLSFKYAYRHVRAGFGRMALSMIAIALGVGLVVAFQLMNAAVLQSFLDTIDAMAGRAQLMVSAGEGLSFSEDVLEKVKAVPGVKLAVPLVRSSTFPDDNSGEMLTVQGVDLTNESAIRVYHDADKPSGSPDGVIDDMVEFLNSPDSIILGREFADKRGLKKGDKLSLVTPNGVQPFTIKGLLDAQGLAQTLRGRIVVMDLFAAERAFTGDRQINQIDVLLNEGASVEAVKDTLSKAVGTTMIVEEPRLRKSIVRNSVAGFQAMVTAFSLLAILAGFVTCYSRLSAVFESRTWEVGLLRAIGMPQREVFLELLKESLLLGTGGIAGGVALGVIVGHYALPFFAAATAIAFRLPAPAAQSVADWSGVGIGCCVGIVAALAAAIVPAFRLARAQPVSALAMRGRELKSDGGFLVWVIRLLLVAGALALILLQQTTHTVVLGHITTVLIAIVTGLTAAPLVRVGAGLATTLFRNAIGHRAAMAASSIVARPRRASLTVATLGVGLGAVLLFGLLGWSFERTLVSILNRSLRANLIISSAFVSGAYWGAPLGDQLVDEVDQKGVAAAAGEQSIELTYASSSIFLKSYDATFFHDSRVYAWPKSEVPLPSAEDLITRGEAVFVTRAFSAAHGVRPGDNISLQSPHGPISLLVAAVTDVPIENAVVMNREKYRELWDDRQVSLVHVALQRSGDEAAVRREIDQTFGARYRVQVRSREEIVSYFADQVRQAFAVLYLMEFIVFLLALVGIMDTLASSVADRTREIGMLRAVGLSRLESSQIIVLESLILGILGLGLAAVAGAILGLFWVNVQFPAVLGWKLDFYFPTHFVVGAAALTIGLCLVGSLIPMVRAGRLSVPESLHYE